MNIHPLLGAGYLQAIMPELVLCGAGMFLILFDAFLPRLRSLVPPLALIAFIVTIWVDDPRLAGTFFGGTYEVSLITHVFDLTFLLAGILVTLLARDYLDREGIEGGE